MNRISCLCLCIAAICRSHPAGFAQTSLKNGTKPAPTKAEPPKTEKADEKVGPKQFAVLIGVENYAHPKLSKLNYSVDDVTALAEVLKGTGYQVTLLTDDTGKKDKMLIPTRGNFEYELKRVLALCKTPEDKVLVAFAGHGLEFEGQKDVFFCPQDAVPLTTDLVTLISLSKVCSDLDRSFAGVKIVLVDACRNDPDPFRGGGFTICRD